MKRILVMVMALAFLAACGNEGDKGGEAAGSAGDEVASPPPSQPAIPEEGSGWDSFVESIQGHIVPAFDEQGEALTKAVGPGDIFEVYVVGKFNDAVSMSAAEYRMIVPEGVEVLGVTHTDSILAAVGTWDKDLSLAFTCIPGPVVYLSRFLCRAEDNFQGGTIETTVGFKEFMGFVVCPEFIRVEARGGTAELKRE